MRDEVMSGSPGSQDFLRVVQWLIWALADPMLSSYLSTFRLSPATIWTESENANSISDGYEVWRHRCGLLFLGS